jgi:large subunit ribosomal protein L21
MSKIAIIETGGKQYVVKEDDVLSVEKIGGEKKPGSKLTFDKVLLVDDGKAAKVGTPHVSGVKVEAELIEDGLGKKISVIRFKAKSRYFKKKGHRQPYTKVKITKIS